LIRGVVLLPFRIAERVVGLAADLLPFGGGADTAERPPAPDVDVRAAAREAVRRDRDPVEEAIFTPDDDFFEEEEHVDVEVELVAESADARATEPPGPQIHVDEPWEGYRRMKVSEIVPRLEGQSAEALAAVELYEASHRNRRGVLEAVRTAARP
jgi:hypothetical protein